MTRAEAITWSLGDVDAAERLLELLAKEEADILRAAAHQFVPEAARPVPVEPTAAMLLRAGQAVVDWATDTGDCLFCDFGETGIHEECPLAAAIPGEPTAPPLKV